MYGRKAWNQYRKPQKQQRLILNTQLPEQDFHIWSTNWKIASDIHCKDTWKQNQLALKQRMKPSGEFWYNNARKLWIFKKRIETKPKKLQARESCEWQKSNAIQTHCCTHMQHKVENPKSNGSKNTSKWEIIPTKWRCKWEQLDAEKEYCL